jgi:hypothetical protein
MSTTTTKTKDTFTGTIDNWDQTDPRWLVDLDADQLGTGLFIVSQTDPNQIKKSKKSDVTYSAFKDYAVLEQAIAIKWVPHTIADETTVLRLKCHGYCETTCVQPGCICDSINHKCV